jgi:murein DD-endopeptidase MepM/ murein hydrolase activator NlpD
MVAFSGPVGGAGWVTLRHGGGLETTYGVLDPRSVRTGQRVRAGAVLGQLSPSAGHLDWGARLDGAYVDPLGLLGSWQIGLAPVDPRPSAGRGSRAAPAFDGVYAPPRSGPPGP